MNNSKAFAIIARKGEAGFSPQDSAAIRAAIADIEQGSEVLVGIVPTGSLPGAMGIMPIDEAVKGINEMLNLCGQVVDHNNPAAVMDLLNDLSAWLSYAGTLQANAKYWLLVAEMEAFGALPENINTPTERRRWITAKCAEYAALYEQAERLTAAITHRCDHLRTFISYAKTEMSLAAFPPAQK